MKTAAVLCAAIALTACQSGTVATDETAGAANEPGAAVQPSAATPPEPSASTEAAPEAERNDDDPDVLRATSIGALRANHPADGEGAGCVIDDDCHAPLRCSEGECGFPSAMTGESQDSEPVALFETAAGRSARYHLELAETPNQIQRGLMYRRTMADRFGMLVVFPSEEIQQMSMRNTFISLDLVFLDGHGRVVQVVENARPGDEAPISSTERARYAIQLVSGEAESMGLELGDRVDLMNLRPALRPAPLH